MPDSSIPFPVIDPPGSRETLASSVYSQLRADLLRGALPPESKLRVDWVVATYRAGASPVREALNRLASEGLLHRQDQRGFSVVPVSRSDMEELTRTRCWLEETALRESIRNRTAQWEEQVVLALHRLSRTPRMLPACEAETNPEWERRHREFHQALISGCRSRWLLGFCCHLADHAYRYRQIARAVAATPRDERAEHSEIADRAIDGDADSAVEALLRHYRFTNELCLPGLPESGPPAHSVSELPVRARKRKSRAIRGKLGSPTPKPKVSAPV